MKVKTIDFKRVQGTPLYRQLYQKLQSDILSGYLVKGDQLPSIRKCANLLKISVTSVERAYECLEEEGYVKAIPQKGYFVEVDSEKADLRKHLIEQPKIINKDEIRYDFRSQSMDCDAFDITLWKKYLKEVLETPTKITTYGNPQGEEALRYALQKYAYTVRGVLCRSEQILIGSSFQSLLYILCGLLNKSCNVGMEEAGFLQAETVFTDYGFTIKKIPYDEQGICIPALYQSDIDLLYINTGSQGSNHQPLTKTRRNELLQWAKERNALIIEDDHNGELRYQSKTLPSMQGFDLGQNVIYIGSFSKLLLPAIRISYMVFTKSLLAKFQSKVYDYSPNASKIEQLALAHYIVDGHLERHVKRLRKRYERKSTLMEQFLKQYFPMANCILEEASLQFILRFPNDFNPDEFIIIAKANKILVQKNRENDIILSFAAIKEEDMEKAIQHLKTILSKQ